MIRKIKSVERKGKYDESIDFKQFLIEKANEELDGNCLLLVYKYNQVYIGSIIKDNLNVLGDDQFELKYITEIRMFSESGELHLWKYGDDFKWRLRIDEEEEGEVHIYEEKHVIWGTKVNNENPDELVEEHRGMRIQFPQEIINETLPLKYEVRNYFNFDDDGMIKFYDARLVRIINSNGGVING
ncbi:hypothetical protein LCGC14_0654110 [marine sediment metagenome]|uniref:Uncharacterized protein n=1 Tax=marine sediment metagenome TaxID=412755 RepID=A0A0F9R0R6_9ZZZZ